MKTPLFMLKRSTRFAMLFSLAFIAASFSRVQAQYTVVSGTSYLNVYFTDGAGNSYGTSPYFGVNTSGGEATPLASYGAGSWLVTGSTPAAFPGSLTPYSGNYDTGSQTLANAKARVSYQQGNLFFGSNTISQTSITPLGTSLYLDNTALTTIAELRIDWTATYNYSGNFYYPGWVANTLYTLGAAISDANGNIQQCISAGTSKTGSPPGWSTTLSGVTFDGSVVWQLQGQVAPSYMPLTIDGTVNKFSAVAGQETFTIYNNPGATGGVAQGPSTQSIPEAGDFVSAGYPSALSGLAPNGVFWGYSTPGPFDSGLDPSASTILHIIAGQSITVSGFLDVFVDPGSMQVNISPLVGIGQVGGQPVVFWPAGLTNFVLESTPSLTSPNWTTNTSTVTTSNGTNSITITPGTAATFYRLKNLP